MKNKPRLLIVEDDKGFREFLVSKLEANYEILEAATGEECIEMVSRRPDIILLDVNLPSAKGRVPKPVGLDLIQEIHALEPWLEIIVISGVWKDEETSNEAIQRGAYDYVIKDGIVSNPERLTSISNALAKRRLAIENRALKFELDRKITFADIIGESPQMRQAKQLAIRWANTESDILLMGETGVGKDLFARAIHNISSRKEKEFVELNCGSLSKDTNTARMELFGVVKDFFHSGLREQQGVFRRSEDGTLMLNEIGLTPSEVQPMLLNAIQYKRIERLGEEGKINQVDVRIIYATDVDLDKAIKENQFLQSLKGRLDEAARITIPPLRERLDDIPLLISHFLPRINIEIATNIKEVSDEVMRLLCKHEWPENIRELKGLLKNAAVQAELAQSNVILPEHLPYDFLASLTEKLECPQHKQLEESISRKPPTRDDILPLPHLNSESYLNISDKSLQQKIFIRTFVESKGNLVSLRERLKVARATATQHLEKVKTEMLTALCKVKGNFDVLASKWEVSPEDLRVSFARASRFCDLAKSKTAAELGVNEQEFEQAYQRLKEISPK